MKYRKKPVVIEAVQWDGKTISETPEWICDALNANHGDMTKPGTVARIGNSVHIATLEGITVASPGDFIIRGIKGELYACKPDIFELTYEPAP